MNQIHQTAFPDEDRIELPDTWTALLLPKRGSRLHPDLRLDAKAVANVKKLLQRYDQLLRQALAKPANADHADAAHAYLAGEPDPRGAGAVTALMHHCPNRSGGSWLRPEIDAWYAEHGLPFTACAAIETMATSAWQSDGSTREAGIETRFLVPMEHNQTRFILDELQSGLVILRGLLAQTSDETYQAAAVAIEDHRDTEIKRLLAMLLFPDRADFADEACREYRTNRGYGHEDLLFWHAVEHPEHLAATGLSKIDYHSVDRTAVAALIDGVGTASLPILAATLEQRTPPSAEQRRTVLKGVALLPSDDAAAHLFGHLDRPFVLPAAMDFAARFPVRAMRAIAALAESADTAQRARLTSIARAEAERLAAVLPRLDTASRAVLNELLSDDRGPIASPDELPALLTAPSWTVKHRKPKPVVIEGLEAPDATALVWRPGELERWAAVPCQYFDGDHEYWRRLIAESEGRMKGLFFAFAPLDLVEDRFADWDGQMSFPEVPDQQRLLARYGHEAIRVVLPHARKHSALQEALLPVLSLEAARLAADRFTRLKSARSAAIAWLDRHRADGAAFLIPDALGSDRKARRTAEAALALITKRHGPDTVLEAAERYGETARDAIAVLLDADPLEAPQGVKIPKPSSWAVPAMLPRVLLKGREAVLPPEAVEHLITVLAIATPDMPYAGIDVLAGTCDEASLRECCWVLFELWLTVGAPPKDSWAFTQLVHFADDDLVGRLAPLICEWPGQKQHKRAVTGLEVLGAIGSEAALRAIHQISQKVKFKALKSEATTQIDNIAQGLGLSTEQLADRLVPDFGLDEALVLDFGPRRFTVRFDEQLKPFVTDEDGKPRKSLPKPGSNDDAGLAEAAAKRFALLKKGLRTVAAEQLKRLEQAMIASRTWTVGEFRTYLVDHPLMWHLARRLVWLAQTDGPATAFRLAEDRTCTDAADEELTLPAGAVIRLAHPALLGDAAKAWGGIFADYEILQPFEQLTLPVMAFTDEELTSGRLKHFEGITLENGRVLGLLKRGWKRAAPGDAGVEPGISYQMPGAGYVIAELDPGISGYIDGTSSHTLHKVYLSATETYRLKDGHTPDHPHDIDPVTASEVLTALARVTRTA